MSTILGIESTAHTFGVAVVRDGKILSNCKKSYSTESGGMIPMEVAKFHAENKQSVYDEAIEKAGIVEEDFDAVAFSQGPGLAPCLIEGMKFAKEICGRLKVPIVGVNHCVAHLEVGKISGARDAVMLYASGANTQVIAFASGKYRVFGETLDIGVGNFIDSFGRYAGIGFPAGPKIMELASLSKNYIELPYKVKGMDVAFSGILTKLRGMLEKINSTRDARGLVASKSPSVDFSDKKIVNCRGFDKLVKSEADNKKISGNFSEITTSPQSIMRNADAKQLISERSEGKKRAEQSNYTLNDLCFSLQETVFAMLVEVAERAMAHTGKVELLLGGGVACNTRLQEMCKIMCKERGAKCFIPENSLLVDNAGMIGFLGEIMFEKGLGEKNFEKIDIQPRQRTDEVIVGWKE